MIIVLSLLVLAFIKHGSTFERIAVLTLLAIKLTTL